MGPTATQSAACTATRTSSLTAYVPHLEKSRTAGMVESGLRLENRSFRLTARTLSLRRGTRRSAFGSSQPARPPAVSSVTPTMFCLSPSPPTTVKSFPAPATEASSSGTPWATASSQSPRRATLNGSPAFASAPTPRTRSSFLLAGTSLSRYVRLTCFSLLTPYGPLSYFRRQIGARDTGLVCSAVRGAESNVTAKSR